MKEAFGTTIMLEVFLVLFVIYIAFMAVVINYATTFQNKNQIITILEKNQGYNSLSEDQIADYMTDKNIKNGCNFVNEITDEYHGYRCEIKKNVVNAGEYYEVVVFVQFSIPFLNRTANFPIKGETKTINYVDKIEINKAPVVEE